MRIVFYEYLEWKYNMPLQREEYTITPPEVQYTEEETRVVGTALRELGHEIVRTTCDFFRDGKYEIEDGLCWTPKAYHLQEGLRPNHEVAIWGARNMSGHDFSFMQQIVQRQKVEEFMITQPRPIAIRPDGPISEVIIPELDLKSTPFEESISIVRDTHETINFYAKAHGYEPCPIEY